MISRALLILVLLASPQERPAAEEIETRLKEASKVLNLGLLRRGRDLLDALERDFPESAERARALRPPEAVKRGRYDGVIKIEDAARLKRVEDSVNAWFDSGTAVKIEAPLPEYLAAIRRGAKVSASEPTGLLSKKTKDGIDYLLKVPKTYSPESPMRLLISLHGTGGTPRSALAPWGSTLDAEEDLIVAFPDGGLPGWGNSRAGHDRILSVLREVVRTYAIDLDRVCLDGASMGAHGSFFLAMYHPDKWAAIAPRVGSARFVNQTSAGGMPDVSPAPAILDNLWRTPVFLIAGAKDPKSPIDEVRITMRRLVLLGTPLVYRESPEGGHEWFPGEDRDVLDFLRFHVRSPYPLRVKFFTREKVFPRSYWIEMLESNRNPRIEITHIDMERKPIEMRREYDRAAEIDAQADRARNKITIRSSGVKEIRVWLSDELLDLDKPLKIEANGSTVFEGKVERSLTAALEDSKARNDRGMPYVASVTIRIK